MRRTITLSEEADEILRLYASANGISLSRAVSRLVIESARPKEWIKYKQGFPIFNIEPGQTITDEHVRELADEFSLGIRQNLPAQREFAKLNEPQPPWEAEARWINDSFGLPSTPSQSR